MDKVFLFLAVMMVITGTINTISNKLADNSEAVGIDGKKRTFDHPYVQTAAMFLGEFSCLWVFYIIKCYHIQKGTTHRLPPASNFSPFIFLLPACCDMTATSLMNVGLGWTYASVFQMLRGAVIIFVGILSVVFLKRKLRLYHWTGMFLVLLGLGAVGLSSVLFDQGSASAPHPLAGNVIIVGAQVIVAIQMVIEEKFIGKYTIPPLQVVGFEGLWGLSVLSIVLVIFYFIPGSSAGNHFENTPDAFVQMGNNGVLFASILGNVFSIAFFNFFGISITKYASATTRMVLDSIRTVVIWAFSLIVGWQKFQWLQIVGFVFLLTGTCIYNEIIVIPFLGSPEPKKQPEERDPLLPDNESGIQRND